jgi:hypothetical protein
VLARFSKRCFPSEEARDNHNVSDSTPHQILIGREQFEHVVIDVLGDLDEDWSSCNVTVRCDVWSGTFRWNAYRSELPRFADALLLLYKTLSGVAELQPLEPNLHLKVYGNGKGHMTVEGKAIGQFTSGAYLVFQFDIDQTDIPKIVKSLRVVDR